ncbi:MAG: leucine-rich repeat domain-containing protein, partial [bacterium]|nr:leucine-rich repeat domain-containing protein [bacterium]
MKKKCISTALTISLLISSISPIFALGNNTIIESITVDNNETVETKQPTNISDTVDSTDLLVENEINEPVSSNEDNGIALMSVGDELESVDGFKYIVLNGTYCSITGYTGDSKDITIPSEIGGYIVQSIGERAFYNNETIVSVILPNTVETIGGYSFYNCAHLSSVTLPEGLTTIYAYAFQNCTSLESI